MNNLTSILTSTVAIIIYIILLSVLAIYIVGCILKKNSSKRLRKHNTMELKKLVSNINEEVHNTKNTVAANNMRTIKRPKEELDVASIDTIKSATDLLVQETPVVNEPISPSIDNSVVVNSINTLNVKEDIVLDNNNNIETLNINNTENNEIEKIYIDIENQVDNNEIIDKQEETLQYTTIEPQQEEAKRELEKITEQLKKEEQENNLIEHTAFEDEQEKNAIISLDELMNKADTLYIANEETQYKDEGNEPISIQDLEEQMKKQKEIMETISIEEIIEENIEETPYTSEDNNIDSIDINDLKIPYSEPRTEKVTLDDFSSVKINKQETKKEPYKETFKTSPVISPVYGIAKNEENLYSKKTELELENTANYEKLDEEIRKTNEFLATLKELQNKLD